MCCHINENDKVLEGFQQANVVHRESGFFEVWCEDWEKCYGNFPPNMPIEYLQIAVNVAVRFYKDGEKEGIEYGKKLKSVEIVTALGLNK